MAFDPGDLSGRPLLGARLDQPLFVDRERELDLVERSVRRRSNALVLGRRGSGKTSFLHRVALDLEQLDRHLGDRRRLPRLHRRSRRQR